MGLSEGGRGGEGEGDRETDLGMLPVHVGLR